MSRPDQDLATVPFAELLARAIADRFDGVLLCTRAGESRRIFLDEGQPIWATSDSPDESLAAFLFRRGRIGLDRLEDDPSQLVEHLPDDEAIGQQSAHALELLLDLFAWEAGRCEWIEEAAPTPSRLRASHAAIVASGVARCRSLEVLRRGAGLLTKELHATSDAAAETISALPLETRTLLDAIRRGSREGLELPSDHQVLQSVWALRLLGLIVDGDDGLTLATLLAAGSEAAPPPTSTEPQSAAKDELALDALDALGELDLPIDQPEPAVSEAPAAASAAAIAVPPVAPPAAVPPVAPPPVASRAAAAAAASARSQEVEGEPEVAGPPPDSPSHWASDLPTVKFEALDPSELAGNAEEAPAPTAKPSQEQALMWFRIGEQALKERDKFRAVTAFREASNLAPDNANYRLKLGLAMAQNPKWRKDAEAELLRCEEMKPWDPKVHIALGKLYKMSKLDKRAIARFQKALELDGSSAEAARELQELGGKAKGAGGFLDKLRRPIGKDAGAGKADEKAEADDLIEV